MRRADEITAVVFLCELEGSASGCELHLFDIVVRAKRLFFLAYSRKKGRREMRDLVKARGMTCALGIVAALLVGMAQRPRSVADEWAAVFRGMGPEDLCTLGADGTENCPNEGEATGCVSEYTVYTGDRYLDVLSLDPEQRTQCNDEIEVPDPNDPEAPPAVFDGDCDDGAGENPSDEECSVLC